jgi:hypothetical protein
LVDPRTPRAAATHAQIDAGALARAFAGGTEALRRQTDAINAINVFPVPDGDTGTNMYMTMRAALDSVESAALDGVESAALDSAVAASPAGASAIAKAAAQGALMGAKGNSGVILSQVLAGIAETDTVEDFDANALAAGFRRARDAAYNVVSAPKEGTILTAISAAAEAATDAASRGLDPEATLAAAVDAAAAAVARTPDLLPVLKEAGVVDAGAQGLFVLLEGMLRALRGEETAAHTGGFGAIDASWIAATRQVHAHGEASGFCTEFVVSGQNLDPQAIRQHLAPFGDSLLVVGGGEVARVHVHTHEPQRMLAYGRSLGEIVHENVADMEAQFRALADSPRPAQREAGIAVIAVGAGDGIERLLESLGASVVRGGQTMNPSAGDIRAAVEASGALDVVLLPNNKNIVMAAKQAVDGLPLRARVIETRSVPQGIAALVALNSEAEFEENLQAMRDAAANVRYAEVTHAARATTLHGMQIAQGQPIGIIDGDLQVAEATVAGAVCACVQRMVGGREAPLITLYVGADETEASAEALAVALRGQFAAEVEVVPGGQPHYPYLVGVE